MNLKFFYQYFVNLYHLYIFFTLIFIIMSQFKYSLSCNNCLKFLLQVYDNCEAYAGVFQIGYLRHLQLYSYWLKDFPHVSGRPL